MLGMALDNHRLVFTNSLRSPSFGSRNEAYTLTFS